MCEGIVVLNTRWW